MAPKKIPSRVAGIPITQIGFITRNKKIFLTTADGSKEELEAKGWEHFKSRK